MLPAAKLRRGQSILALATAMVIRFLALKRLGMETLKITNGCF
jgi:hypothetical protein